jgi:hypothetical protein
MLEAASMARLGLIMIIAITMIKVQIFLNNNITGPGKRKIPGQNEIIYNLYISPPEIASLD